MPDQNAALSGLATRRVPRLQEPFVFHHVPDRGKRELRVPPVAHTFLSKFRFREFKVRKEYIHLLGVGLHHFRFLITGAVEESGDQDLLCSQRQAKIFDVRPKMVRRHKIEVMHPFMNKGFDLREKFGGGHCPAVMADRYLVVLTEKTLAGTTAEKDRPGTASPRERRLLAEMRSDECNATNRAFSAKSQPSLGPVDFAVAGT